MTLQLTPEQSTSLPPKTPEQSTSLSPKTDETREPPLFLQPWFLAEVLAVIAIVLVVLFG
jgi:hypothetical protein